MGHTIIVCGLFEQELVEKGLMRVGRCRDCFYYDGDYVCRKKNEKLEKELIDCKDWVIDTR